MVVFLPFSHPSNLQSHITTPSARSLSWAQLWERTDAELNAPLGYNITYWAESDKAKQE